MIAGIAESGGLAPLGRGIADLLEQPAVGGFAPVLKRLDMPGRVRLTRCGPCLYCRRHSTRRSAVSAQIVAWARHLDLEVILHDPTVGQRYPLERDAEAWRQRPDQLAAEHGPGSGAVPLEVPTLMLSAARVREEKAGGAQPCDERAMAARSAARQPPLRKRAR